MSQTKTKPKQNPAFNTGPIVCEDMFEVPLETQERYQSPNPYLNLCEAIVYYQHSELDFTEEQGQATWLLLELLSSDLSIHTDVHERPDSLDELLFSLAHSTVQTDPQLAALSARNIEDVELNQTAKRLLFSRSAGRQAVAVSL